MVQKSKHEMEITPFIVKFKFNIANLPKDHPPPWWKKQKQFLGFKCNPTRVIQ